MSTAGSRNSSLSQATALHTGLMQAALHLVRRCVSGTANETCSVQCRPGRYLMDVPVAFSGMAAGMIKALFHLMQGM